MEGKAEAEAYHYEPLELHVGMDYFKAGKETEYWKAFKAALTTTKNELVHLQEAVAESDKNAAMIFSSHVVILEDEDLLYEIQNAILCDRMYPEIAIEACFGQQIAELEKVRDEMIAQRLADLYDVKRRLLCAYLGRQEENLLQLKRDAIIVANNLLPSDVATMDRKHVKGIVIEQNLVNSHVAVLAKGLGIPMLVGVESAVEKIKTGTKLVIDAFSGELIF